MIEAISGLPGAGKTLFMMKNIISQRRKHIFLNKIYRSNDQLIQITNFPLNFDYLPTDDSICHIQIDNENINTLYSWILKKKYFGATIYIDEAGILFPSMSYKDIPKSVILGLCQHRHAGYNMFYTCQSLEQVYAGVRRVTAFITEISGWPFLRFSTFSTYELKNGKPCYKNKFGRGIFFHTKRLYNSYSTYYNIETPDYL